MRDRSDTLHGPIRMWLTVFSGPVPAVTVEVTGSRFMIGLGEDCDLVLDDSKVSRRHAVIVPGRGPFRSIRDLDSANGTLVDGRLVRAPTGFAASEVKETELAGAEWLQFGDTTARSL